MYSLTFYLYTFRSFWFWWLWPLASLPCQPNNTMAFMVPIHRGTHTAPFLVSTDSPSILLTLHLSAVGSIPICILIIFTIIMPFPISVTRSPTRSCSCSCSCSRYWKALSYQNITFVTVKRFEKFFRNNLTNDLVLIGLIHF
jgi:hypothetical protein